MTDQNTKILAKLGIDNPNHPLAKALPAAMHWQLKLGDAANDNLGDVVISIDDIHQSISLICTTQKRSLPHEPNFAVDIETYLDKPSPEAIPAIVSELTEAIITFEPRIVLLGVKAEVKTYESILATVTWRPVEAVSREIYTTQVPL